jgi:hypothetical protein
MKKSTPPADEETLRLTRRGLLAKIHVARKDLALAEESYRAILKRMTGKESAGDCGDGELVAVLDEFRRLGWKGDKPREAKPQVTVIYGLWRDLTPFLRHADEAALRAFCRRQVRIEDPRWMNAQQANKVIEALKSWLVRERGRAAGAEMA